MTRMWGIDPELLCRQHLLGEHNELHRIVGHITAGQIAMVKGHAEKGQIDTSRITHRHDALAAEMEHRGYNHDSPLDYDDDLDLGSIDVAANIEELYERCADCRGRIESRRGTYGQLPQ